MPYVHLGIRVAADRTGLPRSARLPAVLAPPSRPTASGRRAAAGSSVGRAGAATGAGGAARRALPAAVARDRVLPHAVATSASPRSRARARAAAASAPDAAGRRTGLPCEIAAGEQAGASRRPVVATGGAPADRSRRRPRAPATRVPHAAPPQAVEPAARARVQRSGAPCSRLPWCRRREPETATPARKLHHGCGGSPAAAAGGGAPARITRGGKPLRAGRMIPGLSPSLGRSCRRWRKRRRRSSSRSRGPTRAARATSATSPASACRRTPSRAITG